MRHLHRLPGWQRRTLFAAGALLLASGVAWLGLHYGRADDSLPAPLEAWLMRLHGLAGFIALFCFGALAAAHIPQGLRLSRRMRWAGQRSSGLLLCGLAGALALTGYLLYYFAPDVVRPTLGWLHSGLGVLMAALIFSHRRRSRSATGANPAGGQIARPGGGSGGQDPRRGLE
ncbi:MAG TPA: hypothetical protein VGH48_18605 [Caldimonas sp.]|jgi:hypothetical protein